jgi:hypothetical protein
MMPVQKALLQSRHDLSLLPTDILIVISNKLHVVSEILVCDTECPAGK